MLNVWGEPTSFVLSAVIVMFASTYLLTAGPHVSVPAGPQAVAVVGSGARVIGTPLIVTSEEAFAVNVPTELLLIVSLHVATSPLIVGVAQVLLWDVGAGVTVGVIELKVAGPTMPGFVVTVMSKTWSLPTS